MPRQKTAPQKTEKPLKSLIGKRKSASRSNSPKKSTHSSPKITPVKHTPRIQKKIAKATPGSATKKSHKSQKRSVKSKSTNISHEYDENTFENIFQEVSTDIALNKEMPKFQTNALSELQKSTENYINELLEDTEMVAK